MVQSSPESVAPLVEHFFRHEASRLVSVLTRIFGWRNFDLVEDMVQATLVDALQAWRHGGVPDNPSGWVHRVATVIRIAITSTAFEAIAPTLLRVSASAAMAQTTSKGNMR